MPPDDTSRSSWWIHVQQEPLGAAAAVLGLLGLLVSWVFALLGVSAGVAALVSEARSADRNGRPWVAIAGTIMSGLVLLNTPSIAVLRAGRGTVQESGCRSNLTQLAQAVAAYTQDYDDVCPRRRTWCDATLPYSRNEQVYKCPGLPNRPCGYGFEMWMDRRVSGDIISPDQRIMLFDAKRGEWNLSGSSRLLSRRHGGGANVAFADGHVAWTKGWPVPRRSEQP